MLVIENCNSLSDLRQKLIDGEEVRTARQEPCEDAISRQAVLEAVKKNTFRLTFAEEQDYEGHVAWSAEAVYSDVIEGALLELPSVNPQPKTGHWIRCLIRNEKGGCIGAKMICSECGNDNKHDEYMIYCPNCGEKMDERREVRDKV